MVGKSRIHFSKLTPSFGTIEVTGVNWNLDTNSDSGKRRRVRRSKQGVDVKQSPLNLRLDLPSSRFFFLCRSVSSATCTIITLHFFPCHRDGPSLQVIIPFSPLNFTCYHWLSSLEDLLSPELVIRIRINYLTGSVSRVLLPLAFEPRRPLVARTRDTDSYQHVKITYTFSSRQVRWRINRIEKKHQTRTLRRTRRTNSQTVPPTVHRNMKIQPS